MTLVPIDQIVNIFSPIPYPEREREGNSHVTLVPMDRIVNMLFSPIPCSSHTLIRLLTVRGKTSFDQSGVGAELPAEIKKEDDEFDLYRKRMMLAYRFRPNPLVRQVIHVHNIVLHGILHNIMFCTCL